MKRKVLLVILMAAAFTSIFSGAADNGIASGDSSFAPVYGYRIVNTYPHDKEAFTEGLVYDQGVLYEGTGLYDKSSLRRVELETGRVLEQIHLPDWFFGEGVTVWKDQLIQLTWQSGAGFVYDKDSLHLIGNFNYKTEGWGITFDGKHLIMSDGTDTLHILDPATFEELSQINVTDSGVPIRGLNELEYVRGEIYANVWPTSRIAIVSLETGKVKAWIDLAGILSEGDRESVDVLNGIAYDAKADRLFVTGKLWPSLFQIEIVAKDRLKPTRDEGAP